MNNKYLIASIDKRFKKYWKLNLYNHLKEYLNNYLQECIDEWMKEYVEDHLYYIKKIIT